MIASVINLGNDCKVVCNKNYRVLPGDFKVVREEGVAVSTLLGSCVAACIRDRRNNVGGLNHFLLPNGARSDGEFSARYGVHAMEVLINEILKAGSGDKRNLEAKVFGGGAFIGSGKADSVGEKNSIFVMEYLHAENIDVVASDLGGDRARRVIFIPSTGLVRVNRLPNSANAVAGLAERKLLQRIVTVPRSSGVELF